MMGKCKGSLLHHVAFTLLAVGGLNWGLVALFNWDLVQFLFGGLPWLADTVYVLVAVSALVLLSAHWSKCKNGKCKK